MANVVKTAGNPVPLKLTSAAAMPHPSAVDSPATYPSDLASTSSRFLSRALQHTLSHDWQTPDDFLQHFGPETIMQALSDADELRSRLLVKLANVHERIAAKKSISSATEDLRLALDENVTTSEAVLELFPADDRVRYLKASVLWRFMFEDKFYETQVSDGESAHVRSVQRLTFLVSSGLEENLISLQDLIDGIGFDKIASSLPVDELRKVVTRAMRVGRDKLPLDEERLLDVVPLPKLIGFMPLETVWQNVIIQRIAEPYGFVDEVTGASKGRDADLGANVVSPSNRPPKPVAATPPISGKEEPSLIDSTSAVEGADDVRGKAIEQLKEIDRLPPSHEQLSTPILLSIESMYADLLESTSDDERTECIHESFPNDSHLRSAMLALAELLEPSIDVTRPPISEADTEALVKLVVFEERRRKEGTGSSRPPVKPPPLPMGRAASSIPAAARVSVPPPLPGSKGNRSE